MTVKLQEYGSTIALGKCPHLTYISLYVYIHTTASTTTRQCKLQYATKCSLHKCTRSMQILPLCYLHLVAASCSYRLLPKMVLTLCNLHALVVFSFHQLAQILHLHSWWSLQLVLVVFFFRALAHLLMRILQLALCGGGACCGIYIYICAQELCTP